jgi:ribosomal protein S18 acetylase RimI-like enzyme
VRRPYRRRGLGRALIASAFAPLADARVAAVTDGADAGNHASHGLLTSLGARVTGALVELGRPG